MIAIGTVIGEMSILKCVCGAAVIGYLAWKMWGDE